MTRPGELSPEERQRLRDAFEELPKTSHGEIYRSRHKDIEPEWIVQILYAPYIQEEEQDKEGEPVTVIIGRVPEYRQWIKVIFAGTGSSAIFHTAYPDRRLEGRLGGRPWSNI